MTFLRKRPLFSACLLFLIVLFLSSCQPDGERLIPLVCAVGTIALAAALRLLLPLFLRKGFPHAGSFRLRTALASIGQCEKACRLPLILCAGAVLSGLLAGYLYFDLAGAEERRLASQEGECCITGTVIRTGTQTDYCSVFYMRVTEADGSPVSFYTRIYTSYECDVRPGDVLKLNVAFSLPEERSGGFPLRRYLLSRGIRITGESAAPENGSEGASAPFSYAGTRSCGFFETLNAKLRRLLYRELPEDAAGFVSGILLGNRTDVSPSVRRDFRTCGVSYVLAISGMHLSVLLAGLTVLLRRLTLPPVARTAALTCGALLICGISGWSFSVLRAALMLLLTLLAPLAGRKSDPLTSLFAAVSLICAADPAAILDVGLQLSFLAMWGITVCAVPIRKALTVRLKNRGLRNFLSFLAETSGAMLFTLPVQIFEFGELSLWTLPIGFLLQLPAAGVLYSAPLLLLFARIPLIGSLFGGVCTFFVRLSCCLVSLPGKTGAEAISLRNSFSLYALAAALLCAVLICFIRRKHAWHRLLPLVVFAVTLGSCLAGNQLLCRDDTALYMTSTGKNDILTVLHSGAVTLVDVSSGSYRAAENALNEAQNDSHTLYTRVDALVLTHYHRRHIGMLTRLAQDEILCQLLLPEPETAEETEIAASLEALASAYGIAYAYYRPDGETKLTSGSLSLTIEKSWISRSVHPVLTLLLTEGNRRVFYAGAAAEELYDTPPAGTDILLWGLHGPKEREGWQAAACTVLRAGDGVTRSVLIRR